MPSMLNLQIAVMEDNTKEVRELLSEIDRKTENEMFEKAAQHFGFKTIEVHGKRLTTRGEIARIMGYKGESGLRMVCERYDLETLSMGGFAQNVRIDAEKIFNLSPNDHRSVFVGWEVFLLAGMQGTSDAAKLVKLYLLQMEKAGRIAGAALDINKGREQRINEANKVVSMISKAAHLKNNDLRNKTLRYIDEVLDGALALPAQGDLFPTGK